VLEFYSALHGRHRVETYGLAKPTAVKALRALAPTVPEIDPATAEDGEPGDHPRCPICSVEMIACPSWTRVVGGDGRYETGPPVLH